MNFQGPQRGRAVTQLWGGGGGGGGGEVMCVCLISSHSALTNTKWLRLLGFDQSMMYEIEEVANFIIHYSHVKLCVL